MSYVRSFMSVAVITIIVASMVLANFAYASYRLVRLPQELAVLKLTDEQVKFFAQSSAGIPAAGSLVLVKCSLHWRFGIVSRIWTDNTYDILAMDRTVLANRVQPDAVKLLASLWQNLYQPKTDLSQSNTLFDERVAYYKKHGSPDGHGMIVSAGSKIVVFGDINGNFNSLQNHIMELFRQGLIDNNLKLRSNCYVACLGNYVAEKADNMLVLQLLLTLQQANPEQVFLMAQDLKAADFKFFSYTTACSKSVDELSIDSRVRELFLLKLNMVMRALPKVLLVGLQLPSTHSYDFIVFCSQELDSAWSPRPYMNCLVEQHIAQGYAFPCVKRYQRVMSGNDSIRSPKTLVEFVKKFASHVDSQKAYRHCLKSLLRAGMRSGQCSIMRSTRELSKRLKDRKVYEIAAGTVYTCSSCPVLHSTATLAEAFGMVEAGRNGRWYITPYVQ